MHPDFSTLFWNTTTGIIQPIIAAELKTVQELVAMYHKKQLGMKEKGSAAGSSGVGKQAATAKKQMGKTNMFPVCVYM